MKTHKHFPIADQDIGIPVFDPVLSKKTNLQHQNN